MNILILIILAAVSSSVTPPVLEIDLKRPDREVVKVTAITGSEPLEWAGTTLAGGDVNGDGIQDLVISAPGGSDDRPSRRGRLYIVFGTLEPPRSTIDLTLQYKPGVIPGTLSRMTTEADAVINGAGDFDHLGRSLLVTDVDGDAIPDIVVGAPRADGRSDRRADCGEVFVIHGATSFPKVINLESPAPGLRVVRIIGRASGNGLGGAVAGGDVNGDGRVDLVLGSPLASGAYGPLGGLDIGEAHLLLGTGDWPAVVDLAGRLTKPWQIRLRGAEPGDQTGSAVAVGDFDGDGLDDMAIGARGADGPGNTRPDSGAVYLLFGRRIMPSRVPLSKTSNAIIAMPMVGDFGGSSLAFGDTDGDKKADLAIGAGLADGVRDMFLDAGEVHLLEGRTREAIEAMRPPPEKLELGREEISPVKRYGPVLVDLRSEKLGGLVTFEGVDPGDHTSVKGMLDMNGDGKAEILISAEDASSRRNSRAAGGELHIIPGGRERSRKVPLSAAGGLKIYGPVGNVHLGVGAAGVDLDGDLRPELVVSGPQAGRALTGMVWVIRGNYRELLAPPR